MKDLMVMNESKELTMSHLQFADMTGKRKDNVKRLMETLSNQGVISVTQIEEGYIKGDGKSDKRVVFSVNERDSYIVMAQLSPTFTAQLVDEWKTMKEEKNAVQALPDFNNPAIAARAWAEQYEQKEQALLEVKQHKEKLVVAAPKVEFFDKVADSSLVASMGDVAKSFQVGRNKMFSELRDMKILQKNNVPYQRYIGAGYFQVKEVMNYNHISYTTYVTGKGQTWLHKKLLETGFISK